ncbi:MAG: ATP-binding protein, partial [Pseudomonadota bacterium]
TDNPCLHILQSKLLLDSPDIERRLDSGEYIHISIRDNGDGFTDEDLIHAFEPFYTQNREFGGSGLGLSMVQGFSNQSGGNVILSNTNDGAVVDIFLISGKKTDNMQAMPEVLDEGLTILLVEDSDDLRKLIVKHLSIMNINILNASSVEEGKRMLNKQKNIDLVLSDFLLEDGKGSEVVSYAREQNADVKILYISGFLDEAITSEAEKGLVLRKPFTMEELTKMLNKVLSED